VAFAKVAAGGRLGLKIDLDKVPVSTPCNATELLFSESNTRFVMTASPGKAKEIEILLSGIPFAKVGTVTAEPEVEFAGAGMKPAKIQLDKIISAYKETLDHI
jgi:phosphoribosylformylglycinamidine (FGAM) synthase-like enzyme